MASTTAISELPELVQGKVPVEVYLRTLDYEPDCEYVDGWIEERPMGEFGHSSWQQAIQLWFSQHAKAWGIRVRPELRVQVAVTRYRVPDVVVFDKTLPIKKILMHAPIAVFEVLSPEDRLERMKVKLADYAGMGIQTIIVIDPETEPETLLQYRDGELKPLDGAPMTLPGSACTIDWDGVREFLD